MSVEREAVIKNKEGLHFRPIMQLVDLVSKYRVQIIVHMSDRKASATSPMELLMLVATEGTRLRLVAEGEDADTAIEAAIQLIESGFSEH